MYQYLGILMKIEIQSDRSTPNSLTDRLRAGQRTKHTDTRYSWIQERVQDGDLGIKKVPTAEELRRCWNKNQFLLQYYNNIASLQDWYSTDHGSHTPLQDEGGCSPVHTQRPDVITRGIKSRETDSCQC